LSLVIASVLLAGCTTLEAQVAPAAEPLSRWQRHDAGSKRVLDHAAWARFIARYRAVGADSVARVRYASVAPADRAALAQYIGQVQATDIDTLNRAEQFAFWVNLYNAATVRVVLDRYPVASIRDINIGGGLFTRGPWGAPLIEVKGQRLSLDDVEHRILRPLWRDPRIHYVVNCASIGCPDLPDRPLTGATAEAMLDAAARAYVNHPRGVSARGGRVVASSIYRWFREDFGGDEKSVLAHLRRYAAAPLAATLAGASEIDGYDYDWRLNDAR
ncbi:MAG: DUF547 domain-containing protein, partial [Alphaproteobacteria bacterium]